MQANAIFTTTVKCSELTAKNQDVQEEGKKGKLHNFFM